ncbi:MAG: M55 family metallopeptidase [Clostridia bacterium]
MRILIVTDLEGVAGIIDKDNWTQASSPYYEKAKRLLTEETNAAARGFYDAGAVDVIILDGHGPGAIDVEILHPAARYSRGIPTHILCEKFKIDAIAWVGQHAKAGSERAHMAHSGNFTVIDYRLNGISMGEFGRTAAGAGNYGVPPIFGSGDKAFTLEALELCPAIETVAVKECFEEGSGESLTYEEYYNKNTGAIHLSPAESRVRIYKGALKALKRFMENKERFNCVKINPPYVEFQRIRPTEGKRGYDMIKRADTFSGLLDAGEEIIEWE